MPVPAGARRSPSAEYFRGGPKNHFLHSWHPQLREQSEDVRSSWKLAAARTVEAMQNSGFIAGIRDYLIARIVGPRLNLVLQPNAKKLGWTEDAASEWAEDAETGFNAWANDPRQCDAGGRMMLGQMQQLCVLSQLGFGEVVALLPMIRRPDCPGLTRVLMLPPSRLAQTDQPLENIVQGVKVDSYGYPLAYWFERQNRYGFKDEVEIRASDRDGRSNVIHVFDPSLGATRGISPLATVLKVVRQIDQYADATLTASLLQTIFAATIKTNLQGQAAFEGLLTELDQKKGGESLLDAFAGAKADWYDTAKIDLSQHGRIAHMFPTDELQFHKAEHPSQMFDMFYPWLNREVCIAAGVTYEGGTGDYRNATYSSARLSTSIEDDKVKVKRENTPIPFSNPVLDAWMEEEVATGRLGFPGGLEAFLKQRKFIERSWGGPAKPQADDLKTARAQQTLKEIGIGTQQSRSAEYGRDWRSDMDQQARERRYALKKGLPDPYPEPEPKKPISKRSEEGTDEDKTDDPSYAPEEK